jgi:alkanesulfonate monooxygenase SsuD/methylene tetrahydromethanopterin reductase-like flavin-dependent oxidoreductase (luciferase family)
VEVRVEIGLMLPMGAQAHRKTQSEVPSTYPAIRALALDAESAGLDSVWLYDHLLIVEGDAPPTASWEAWTLLSALAAATRTVRLGLLVSCTSFRHPALLARMAHTVQEISAGRLILGLGAGWHEPEYRAFGFPFDHRVDRFAEALEIIGPMLREGRATFHGRYYTVDDCPLLPERVGGPTRTPILIGSSTGERMLGLVARWADAWNTAWYARPNERFAEHRTKLRAACSAAGRDDVELTVGVIVGDADKHLPARPEAVAEAVAAWREEGVTHLICMPNPADRTTVDAVLTGVARASSR